MDVTVSKQLRYVIGALTVYSAVAWGAIEVVSFLVDTYALSRIWLDSTIICSIGGGVATVTVTYYHGEKGRQKIHSSEILLLSSIAILTVVGLIVLSTQDPQQQFRQMPGFRLNFDIRQASPNEGETAIKLFGAGLSPMEGTVFDQAKGFMFHLSPGDFYVNAPDVWLQGEHHPVMFANQDEFFRLTTILDSCPSDIEELLLQGEFHEAVQVETKGLSIKVDRAVKILEGENEVTLVVQGPLTGPK